MASGEDSESAQVQLMREWGKGFEKMDLALVAKHLHKDFLLVTYPRSLGMPDETREVYLQRMGNVMTL